MYHATCILGMCNSRVLLLQVHRLELKYEVSVGAQCSHKVRGALCPAVHVEQPEVLAMGGQDCTVHIYDISRPKKEPVLLAQLKVRAITAKCMGCYW